MAKFSGMIGFATTQDSGNGVIEEVIHEYPYSGDILTNRRRWEEGQKIVSDLTIENRFSIIADTFAIDNTHNMRYLKVSGARWKISSIEIQRPRYILSVSGVYNGPLPVEE